MNELPETLVRFRTELEAAIRREQEAQAFERNGRGNRLLRFLRRRPERATLAFAAVAAAAAAALFVSSPWQSSPGFLERAQAALTSTEPSIVHMKWEILSDAVPDCSPDEIWFDQLPPHRYRVLVDYPRYFADAQARKPVCTERSRTEVGSTFKTEQALEFRPPNMLVPTQMKTVLTVDPVADLREALDAGRAHDEGETRLDGRTVRRIRIDPPPWCTGTPPFCPRRPAFVYVDPETFYPAASEGPGMINGRAVHIRIRYFEFEYLPRTDENLELTDIRAQHPNATVEQ
jgi:hypothetical protein